MSKLFQITVRDSGDVYPSLDSFKTEVGAMVRLYGLPADIESVLELVTTSGAGEEGSSPTESPGPEPSDFHDVAGAMI